VAAPGCPGGPTPSKEAQIIHAYATTDKPTAEIAKEFKLSKARVRAILKQNAPKLLAQYKPFCRRSPLTKERVTDLVHELSQRADEMVAAAQQPAPMPEPTPEDYERILA